MPPPAHPPDHHSAQRRPYRVAASAVVAVVVGIGAVACAPKPIQGPTTTTGTRRSGHGSGTTPAATTAPGAAAITAFDLPTTVACRPGERVTVTATFTTADASRAVILVDQEPVPGTVPVSGTFAVPLTCDDSIHTVVLTVGDEQGRTAVRSRTVAAGSPDQPG